MEVETPTEPTGKELSEQVYNQFAELVEKEKGQAAKIAELQAQLEKHNESLEAEKKKKAEADAAKGQALMQTFIEHINDLVGPEESSLQKFSKIPFSSFFTTLTCVGLFFRVLGKNVKIFP